MKNIMLHVSSKYQSQHFCGKVNQMIELKATTAVESRIEEILSGRVSELSSLEGKIEQESAAIEAINQEMETATAAGNADGYRKAKAKRAAIMDGKEMYEARLDALKNKPLITKEEYEKAVSDIFEEFSEIDDLTREKLFNLSNEMNAAARDLIDAQKKANEVLMKLQDTVYRGADRSRDARTGEIMFFPSESKRIDKWNTIKWGERGVSYYQYKVYTGRINSEENND